MRANNFCIQQISKAKVGKVYRGCLAKGTQTKGYIKTQYEVIFDVFYHVIRWQNKGQLIKLVVSTII